MLNYYILVENHTRGMALHELLDEAGLDNRVAPTPRCGDLKVSCGVSLLIKKELLDAVEDFLKDKPELYIKIVGIGGQLEEKRDLFI